jgi:hypothetical protein
MTQGTSLSIMMSLVNLLIECQLDKDMSDKVNLSRLDCDGCRASESSSGLVVCCVGCLRHEQRLSHGLSRCVSLV